VRSALLALLAVGLLAACATVAGTSADVPPAKDMRLVGHEPLQARSAYQPLVHEQGDRWCSTPLAPVPYAKYTRLQIVDRDRLLNGNPASADRFAPTPGNLRYPEIGRLDMPPDWGGHTSFPVLGIPVGDHVLNLNGRVRDVVVLVSESLRNECQEFRQLTFLVDITTPGRPFPVSTFQVPESPGAFCRRGGRFGPHSSNESFAPIFYGKLVFLAYFNAGVRAVDIRDPFAPREVAYFIPAVTAATDKRCIKVDGNDRCKVAIQTNNVEVDERGFVYLADRADTGLHIVELTGAAKAIVQ